MATKTKITEKFVLTGDDGVVYQIEEHTRYTLIKLPGGQREDLGAAYLKTEDGRGVIKNSDNTYSIPSLGLKAVR